MSRGLTLALGVRLHRQARRGSLLRRATCIRHVMVRSRRTRTASRRDRTFPPSSSSSRQLARTDVNCVHNKIMKKNVIIKVSKNILYLILLNINIILKRVFSPSYTFNINIKSYTSVLNVREINLS